ERSRRLYFVKTFTYLSKSPIIQRSTQLFSFSGFHLRLGGFLVRVGLAERVLVEPLQLGIRFGELMAQVAPRVALARRHDQPRRHVEALQRAIHFHRLRERDAYVGLAREQ